LNGSLSFCLAASPEREIYVRRQRDSGVRVENSFIPVRGVGEQTERSLWRQGITHWDDFERDAVGATTAERIESFIATARDHLAAGDATYFYEQFPSQSQWRLYETFRDRTAFFDIETTGLDAQRHVVTTVSVHMNGETRTLVRGRNLSADAIESLFDGAALLVTFNGKRFDVPFLEQSFDVSLRDRPHLDVMYPCKRLDLTGGLKAIEREVGIERDRPDLSGEDAVRLWREYERGDESALETLVSYNRDDTEHLKTVTETVANRLHRQVFVDSG
jgi:hypothetical protein